MTGLRLQTYFLPCPPFLIPPVLIDEGRKVTLILEVESGFLQAFEGLLYALIPLGEKLVLASCSNDLTMELAITFQVFLFWFLKKRKFLFQKKNLFLDFSGVVAP